MAVKDFTKLKKFCSSLSECYSGAILSKVEIEIAESDGEEYISGLGQVWYMVYVHIDGEQQLAYKCTDYLIDSVMQEILMLSHAVVMREYMGLEEMKI